MKFNIGDKVIAYGNPIQGIERLNPKGVVGTITEEPNTLGYYKVRFSDYKNTYGFTLVYHEKKLRKFKI